MVKKTLTAENVQSLVARADAALSMHVIMKANRLTDIPESVFELVQQMRDALPQVFLAGARHEANRWAAEGEAAPLRSTEDAVGEVAEPFSCHTCVNHEGKVDECDKSPRICGHHCNHTWDNDACCWCGTVIAESGPHSSALA